MLKGEKISLRNIQSKDLAELVELWGNLSVRGDHFPLTVMNEALIKQRFAENGYWGEAAGHMLMIDSRDEIQGAIFYFQPNPFMSYLEVGYIIFHPEARGQGFTSEALSLFSQFLFETKQISKILLNIDPNNNGSRKVAENNGFILEGRDQQAMFRNGTYLDVDRYILLRNA